MGYNARFYREKETLYFHLDKASIAGAPAIPFTWDGPATEEQKNFYKKEYAEFLSKEALENHVSEVMTEASEVSLG